MQATLVRVVSPRDFACYDGSKIALVSLAWLRLTANGHHVSHVKPDIAEPELRAIVENFVPECVNGAPDTSPLARYFPHTEQWVYFTTQGQQRIVRRYAFVLRDWGGVTTVPCPCEPQILRALPPYADAPEDWPRTQAQEEV